MVREDRILGGLDSAASNSLPTKTSAYISEAPSPVSNIHTQLLKASLEAVEESYLVVFFSGIYSGHHNPLLLKRAQGRNEQRRLGWGGA